MPFGLPEDQRRFTTSSRRSVSECADEQSPMFSPINQQVAINILTEGDDGSDNDSVFESPPPPAPVKHRLRAYTAGANPVVKPDQILSLSSVVLPPKVTSQQHLTVPGDHIPRQPNTSSQHFGSRNSNDQFMLMPLPTPTFAPYNVSRNSRARTPQPDVSKLKKPRLLSAPVAASRKPSTHFIRGNINNSNLRCNNNNSNMRSNNNICKSPLVINKTTQSVPSRRNTLFSDSSAAVCRICHGGEMSLPIVGNKHTGEPLISPCNCRGTMGLYHRSCLEHWLGSSNTQKCEICQFPYVIKRKPKSIADFWRSSGHISEKRNIIGDMICFCILTPLACISSYLCIHGAVYYAARTDSEAVEVPGLIVLAVFLICTYCTWLGITLRYHYKVITDWRAKHHHVKVIGIDELPTPYHKKIKKMAVGFFYMNIKLILNLTMGFDDSNMSGLLPMGIVLKPVKIRFSTKRKR